MNEPGNPLRRLAWMTDLHFNFCGEAETVGFLEGVAARNPDAILLGGDLGESGDLEARLALLERIFKVPVFFVLGNHDFYHGSIREVRELAAGRSRGSAVLRWLPEAGVVELDGETGLVGHDGWADGRCGDWEGSGVRLNDYRLIRELSGLGKAERFRVLNGLGDEAAAHLRRVLVLTHVPPFCEAAFHQGRISSPEYLPHFSCKAAGEALAEAARARPDREILVLCGHTHSPGFVEVLPNLRVRAGGATYGRPELQGVIDLAREFGEGIPFLPPPPPARA